MSQLPLSAFQTYDSLNAVSITLPAISDNGDSVAPTQMNEGLTEVGKKAAGFDLLTPSELTADLLTDIEPVVIGPNGQLYLTDGHHTFTALEDSIYGASNPTVYVNVIANYSNLTEAEFFAQMQANNLLLPLNDGVPSQAVNDVTTGVARYRRHRADRRSPATSLAGPRIQHPEEQELEALHHDVEYYRADRRRDARPRQDDRLLL